MSATPFEQPHFIVDTDNEAVKSELAVIERHFLADPERYRRLITDLGGLAIQSRNEGEDIILDGDGMSFVRVALKLSREYSFDDSTEDAIFEDPVHKERLAQLAEYKRKNGNRPGTAMEEELTDKIRQSRLELFLGRISAWKLFSEAGIEDLRTA